jgi:aminoglycoside phosphotransferase (APT) family kinase protein
MTEAGAGLGGPGEESGVHDSPATDVPGVNTARLAHYLPGVLDDYEPAAGLTVRLLTGGRSNLTCLLTQPGGRRWVLRRPPLGHVMPSAHDMAREFRTLSWLSGRHFPAPQPRALCEDNSVLGVTFLIYEYVPGLIISDPATAQGLSEAEAHFLCDDLIRTLARLHAIPPPAAGVGRSESSLGYLGRQITRWTQQWDRTRTRDLPDFGRLAQWLCDEVSSLHTDYPVSFVHGDYRLDNLVLAPASKNVRSVLDWEMSTLGDPIMDLALLLLYWEQPEDGLRRTVNVARNLTTSRGFWSRDKLLREYIQATSLPTDHVDACLALACLKLAVITESIHYRHLAGQALDNLSQGLADATPALLRLGLAVAEGRGLAALAA